MIKLYGISRSRALRSLWAAEETGIDFEHVPIHFVGDSKKPEYLAVNPNGRIPALVDDDLVLFESMAINLYLARKYGRELWPASEADQARAVQWSVWGMTELEPPLMTTLLNRVMLPEEQRDAAAADAAEQGLSSPLNVLDAQLQERACILGDTFTIADLNVASVLALGDMTGVDLSPYPQVQRWMAACTGRPALERARKR